MKHESSWFVMLLYPVNDLHGERPVPVVDDSDDDAAMVPITMLYPSESDAHEAMRLHAAANAWGYEVYEWPYRSAR